MYSPHAARLRACIRRTAAVLGGTAVAMSLGSGIAAATAPAYVAGNPDCAAIQGTASWTQLKIDPPAGGANRIGNGDVSIVATVSGALFDFTATAGVDAVIVKGGPNANVYTYPGEATSGSGLRAPTNPSNGRPYGLSHITFCYDRGTPPPPPDPCTANPNGTDANGQPCTPPADPCKANPNGMDANGQPCTPPADPCKANPNGMDPSGQPCTPPEDLCKANPNGMDASGQPCTPPEDLCKANPSGMDANGQPCTPPADPCVLNPAGMNAAGQPCTPILTREPSATPQSGGSLGQVGRVVPAGASIVRLRRCVARPFSVVVRGRGIRRVTLLVNGRRLRTIAARRSRYAFRVSPARARNGVIRITARVQFVAASGRRAQTLRMTALRCAVGAVQPQFTG